jgi:hypothetical protein
MKEKQYKNEGKREANEAKLRHCAINCYHKYTIELKKTLTKKA